ncbi:hypothetical protein ARMGADRAFT_1067436 [Armillaria gallica]|uniref:Uncharacterized protein n=1 Tax=Armillaria gallica TaxID=47427 RepID=A0A2H3CY80_ARMGA|nr:hypothetical protein ARMGADRAFT_1067436 [Armillaria gallica]
MSSKLALWDALGVLYIGATISAILFGITNLQAVIYYKKDPTDWWVHRYSVCLHSFGVGVVLKLSESWHGMNLIEDTIQELQGFPTQLQLDINRSSQMLIVIYVQGLYAIRLWKLGRHFHKILPWFVVPEYIYDIKFWGCFRAQDIVIALMMNYYLQKSRAATIVSTTPSRLLSLMRIVLMSGLVTSACSLFTLIAFRHINTHIYINSLLTVKVTDKNPRRRRGAGVAVRAKEVYSWQASDRLNYRHKQLQEVNASNAGRQAPAVFWITPHSAEASTPETACAFVNYHLD